MLQWAQGEHGPEVRRIMLQHVQACCTAVAIAGDTVVKPYILGKEARAGDKPQSMEDMLPDWVGYTTLYGISAIPIIIVVATISILFVSSLK
jgi:hypothetical protein